MNVDSPARTRPSPALVHQTLLYRNREQLRGAVSDFVALAVQAGEPVLALLPKPNLQWLPEALGDLAASVRFGDMGVAGRNPNLLLSVAQDWVEQHGAPARLILEPVWPGRSHEEVIEVLRHEALLNLVLASRPAVILCA